MQFLKKTVSRIWSSKITEPASPDDLFAAAERGDRNWIASLIKQGIDPNTRRSDGVTALILAARENRVEAIDALLKGGADPNLPSSEGWYAYHFAKNSKQTEAAAALLVAHKGVEPNFDFAAHYLAKVDQNTARHLRRALLARNARAQTVLQHRLRSMEAPALDQR